MSNFPQNSNKLQIDVSIYTVAQQIKDIYVGAITQSHQVLLDGYHQIGQLILALPDKYSAVQRVGRLSGVSRTTLYNCAKFAEKYTLDKLPEGDNTTWSKMVKKYLPEKIDEEPCLHEEIIKICKKCKMQII